VNDVLGSRREVWLLHSERIRGVIAFAAQCAVICQQTGQSNESQPHATTMQHFATRRQLKMGRDG
jgi:hypothetical protein